MSWYYLEKEFYDYADNIEGVNIHYVWTPFDGIADWENQRATRFMPLVQGSPYNDLSGSPSMALASLSSRLRKKILKLPLRIDTRSGDLTSRYLLHHYFEIFQDGHRFYSSLYTEEIDTDVKTESAAHEALATESSSPLFTTAFAEVK